MTVQQCLTKYGVKISPKQHAEILRLSQKQTELEMAGHRGKYPAGFNADLRRLLVVQLFSLGKVEDCLHIWRAKRASYDAFSSIDAPLLCGAGLWETIRYLEARAPKESEAAEALDCIRKAMQSGDFEDFSPETWLANMQDFFMGEQQGEEKDDD